MLSTPQLSLVAIRSEAPRAHVDNYRPNRVSPQAAWKLVDAGNDSGEIPGTAQA